MRSRPRFLGSSDFLALERFQLSMLEAYLIPRSRDERPITALRVVPSILAISEALRPLGHSSSSRLSRAGVQNDFMAAPRPMRLAGAICPQYRRPCTHHTLPHLELPLLR